MLIDSMNVGVLAENIRYLDKEIKRVESELPPDYSTNETETGQKWIDGKNIYFRVFSGEFGVDNTPVVAGTITDFYKLVACFYTSTNAFGNSTINVATNCYVTSAGAVTCVPSAAAFYEQPFNAIVYYTKPDPTP